MSDDGVRRILVFRLGSMGDFIVALPCFRMLRERYPTAHITLITNLPLNARAAPAQEILSNTKYVDSFIDYPAEYHGFKQLRQIRNAIRSLRPELFVYLREQPHWLAVFRDAMFLDWLTGTKIIGLPMTHDLRTGFVKIVDGQHLHEYEGHRLFRCISRIDKGFEFERTENWDLHLSDSDMEIADRSLGSISLDSGTDIQFVALSVGTKQSVNDWGDANWQIVLDGLKNRKICLVTIGGAEDRPRSQELIKFWPGPSLNLCGAISPRVSGAVLKRCVLFLGHDSGPMHLAAAVGTRCIAVFSRRNSPGKWFPHGAGHKVFYPETEAGIAGINPARVIEGAFDAIDRRENEISSCMQEQTSNCTAICERQTRANDVIFE